MAKPKPCATCKTPYPPADISHDGENCWRCFDKRQNYQREYDSGMLASRFSQQVLSQSLDRGQKAKRNSGRKR